MSDERRTDAEPELPSELAELVRAGREQLGTPGEVAELARRLAAVLGPASGLPSADGASDGTAPASGESARGSADRADATAAVRGGAAGAPAAQAALPSLLRVALWASAGVGVSVAIGLVVFGLSRGPTPAGPSAPEGASAPPTPRAASSEPPPVVVPSAPGLAAKPAGSAEREPAAAEAPVPAADTAPSRERSAQPGSTPRAEKGRRKPPRSAGPRAASRSVISETALLEQARAALRGSPGRALALTRRHEARFPRGLLVQEREVIAIEALKRLGRHDAASARAAAFERRYRGSVHQPRLERATDTSAPRGGALPTKPPRN